jgi:hypothetical protein
MVNNESTFEKGPIMDQLIAQYKNLEAQLLASQQSSLDIALKMQELASRIMSSDD